MLAKRVACSTSQLQQLNAFIHSLHTQLINFFSSNTLFFFLKLDYILTYKVWWPIKIIMTKYLRSRPNLSQSNNLWYVRILGLYWGRAPWDLWWKGFLQQSQSKTAGETAWINDCTFRRRAQNIHCAAPRPVSSWTLVKWFTCTVVCVVKYCRCRCLVLLL